MALSFALQAQAGRAHACGGLFCSASPIDPAAERQGGHHVFVSFRVRGLDPIRVLIHVTTVVEGHPELELTRRGRQSFMPATAASALKERDDDAGTDLPVLPDLFVYTGWPAQILSAPMHRGERARIDVQLTDRNALSARATKTIVIGDPDR